MRIKFKNHIYFCTSVSLPEGSKLLLFTTSNGVYTVDMITSENAQEHYNSMLVNGYCDMSEYQYSN